VTGVCSTAKLELVKSLGADVVIDYTQKDFTQAEQCYELIFDAVAKRSFSDCKNALMAGGIYVTTEFSPVLALAGLWTSLSGDKRMVPLSPKAPTRMDQAFIKELLESGKVTPVIDRRFTLSEIPEALRYLEKGHARGKVIIVV
jgi:NADPH:quinone reductase-like Zn-dependent oxidoreductase